MGRQTLQDGRAIKINGEVLVSEGGLLRAASTEEAEAYEMSREDYRTQRMRQGWEREAAAREVQAQQGLLSRLLGL